MLERIQKTGELIDICEECEAVWPSGVELTLATFETFYSFMARRGLSDRWLEELEDPSH